MGEFYLTNKAVEDLERIWIYTAKEWSEKQADNYYKLLIDNCKKLARNPGLGKSYENTLNDIHGLRSNRHIIFYRIVEKNLIEITRILHERMDLK